MTGDAATVPHVCRAELCAVPRAMPGLNARLIEYDVAKNGGIFDMLLGLDVSAVLEEVGWHLAGRGGLGRGGQGRGGMGRGGQGRGG